MAVSIGAALRRQRTVRPLFWRVDQVGARQHIEMLHHCGQRDRERRRNLGHCQLLLPRQTIDDCAPRRVRERGEGQIELGRFDIVNHMVKYWRTGGDVKPLCHLI